MRAGWQVFCAALIFLSFNGAAWAQRRVALVIGNSAYVNAGRLANTVRDAKAVAQALRETGFEVTEDYDLNKAKFEESRAEALRRHGRGRGLGLGLFRGPRHRRRRRKLSSAGGRAA